MDSNFTHKTSAPTVTIGICIRNCTTTIGETIESIMAQDYPHELMEVIFVDDGSEDNTLTIVKAFASKMDMKVKIFHHNWRGLGPSRNVVVNNAKGKYIVWVDGDMVLPKDHIRKQVEFMEKNPKVGIGKAKYEIYDRNNLVSFLEDVGYVAVDYKYAGDVDKSRALGAGGSIYRVEAIKYVGGFDDKISGAGEDVDIEHRVRNAGWMLFRATPATFYERRRKTLKDLWTEGFWHGYTAYVIFRKNRKFYIIWGMTPLGGLILGAWYSTIAYKMIQRKTVFLLPVHFMFKRIAWFLGFVKGVIDKLNHE